MTNTTPILAIDIDGVLAPLGASKKHRKRGGFAEVSGWRSKVRRAPGSTWIPYSSLHLARRHGDMLAEFSAEHDVELVWGSLWQANANTVVAPVLGLPRLPYVDFHAHPERRFWKFPAMAEYAAGRPLAWLDDGFARKSWHRAVSGFDRARRNLPTLLHPIRPDVGVTAGDLAEVASWLKTARLAWGVEAPGVPLDPPVRHRGSWAPARGARAGGRLRDDELEPDPIAEEWRELDDWLARLQQEEAPF